MQHELYIHTHVSQLKQYVAGATKCRFFLDKHSWSMYITLCFFFKFFKFFFGSQFFSPYKDKPPEAV
jgi:hypothetical protein